MIEQCLSQLQKQASVCPHWYPSQKPWKKEGYTYNIWNEKWHDLSPSSANGDFSWGRGRNDQVSAASPRGSVSWLAANTGICYESLCTISEKLCVEKTRAALIVESSFQTFCYGIQHSTKVDLKFLETVLQIRQRSSLCINNAIRS